MKRSGCFGCVGIVLVLLGLVFVAPCTFELLKEKWKIHELLASAKSVRVEHFRSWVDMMAVGGAGKEQIITSKNLAPGDFYKVADAFPAAPDIGFPGDMWKCAINPHHRIVITDAAGNVTTISVCFECDHIEITHGSEKYGDIELTPLIWRESLRRFFADQGMPNSPGLYRPYRSDESTNASPATSGLTNAAPQ